MPKPKSKHVGAVDSTLAHPSPRGDFDDYSFERGCSILSGHDSFSQSVLTLAGLRFNRMGKEKVEKPAAPVPNEIRTRRGAAKRSREEENAVTPSGKDGAVGGGATAASRCAGGDTPEPTADTFDRMGTNAAGLAAIASQLSPIFSAGELNMIAKHVSTQGKTRSECPDVFTLLVTRGAERRAEAVELFSDLCK